MSVSSEELFGKTSLELAAILRLVAEGEQDQAESMFKKNPNLALYPSDVTDSAVRSFKNITGFQYAIWALDWHMWMMIRKYLSNEKIAEQIQNMKTGSWINEHGSSASWQDLLDALQKQIDLRNASAKWSEADSQWCTEVGGAQCLLPMHVVNEYCRADREFKPCPNFSSTTPLPRTRQTSIGPWYTAVYSHYNSGKQLGKIFAYARGSSHTVRAKRSSLALELAVDLEACRTLLSTRIQQRDQLFAEFSIVIQNPNNIIQVPYSPVQSPVKSPVFPSAPTGEPILNQFQHQNLTQSNIKVDFDILTTFLKHVAKGEQDEAEALLQQKPELALYPSDVTDSASRSFKNITGFQYAIWALDWHMWVMTRKYLSNEKAAEQIQNMKTGSWISEHGSSASWQDLLDALRKDINLYKGAYYEAEWRNAALRWNKEVGGAQCLLPVHVVNEYCRPDQSFDPCPDFSSAIPLPRTRQTGDAGEWYNDRLGDTFAYYRGKLDKVNSLHASLFSAPGPSYWTRAADLEACTVLLNTRLRQRDQLFAELLSDYQPIVHKAELR